MKCPICDNVSLREVEKEGVLIDICPSCKGIWLDRGELEKLRQGLQDEYSPAEDVPDYPRRDSEDRRRADTTREGYPSDRSYGTGSIPPVYENREYGGPYDKHGYNRYGYDKYGRRKKKSSIMDVFENLFD
ncbi:TFIIB-type zinc ribbon-containing protein [Gorillibacterium timonense]|uniref:TFIIB-type zinc ribbon-containing protein n=1 Tax=Gorillibacterium timonense TaxID=1689269 RepID=UPI0009EB4EF9|nr:zf-TFIIB domain-containing protein [Gorillibacterium timonense]